MGKEWLHWGGGVSSKSAKRGRFLREENEAAAPPSGCMCAVFQIFDFNHFQFALHQQPSFKPGAFLEDEPTIPKGVEAPRNSLELEEPSCEVASSSSSTRKDDASLNIPVGIQIRTSLENTKSPRESTSECSGCSPGTKTPGLVARLMGLDPLPEGGSPSLSSSRHSTSSPSIFKSPSLSSSRHSTSSPSIFKSRNSLLHQALNHHNEDRSRHLLQTRPGKNGGNGAHSLPVTPRMSSARRSDVDHRFSLQINIENVCQELDLAAYVTKKVARRQEAKQENESRSPGHYARQIVKQVKESVRRKVGVDITNTINVMSQAQNTRRVGLCSPGVTTKTRDHQQQVKDDEQVVLLKPKKQSRVLTRPGDDECSLSNQSAPTCSPRLRTLPDKNRASHSPKLSSSPSAAKPSRAQPTNPAQFIDDLKTSASRFALAEDKTSLKAKPDVELRHQQKFQEKSMQKCERVYNSRLKRPPQASSDAVRNKKQEPFVRSPSKSKVNNHLTDKMCKKIPLSNELLMNNNVPALLPVKKDPSPATKLIHHKQVSDALTSKRNTQLSSCESQSSYNQQATHKSTTVIFRNSQDICHSAATTTTSSSGSSGAEYQYIKTIIKRTGIDKTTPVSLAKWYSPSHPLDPAIFHYIELFHHTNTIFTAKESKLCHRSNRKLIFQLVDELLAEILKPFINLKPWLIPFSRQCCQMDGCELIDTLCSRIQAFPSANCQVLDDIDALIDKDLCNAQQKRSSAFEEEGESIVLEIERDILESLVHEMASEVLVGNGSIHNVIYVI